jgi:hypothetical protein
MSLVNKYIDSNNFLTAISVYNEEGLSSLAPDGYYENNGIYRRQLSGLLGPSVACESCAPIYSSLSLCFSSVSANELCCGNSTSVTVFVAGTGITTLASVTGFLYTTSALDVEAAVGFYSDDLSGGCNPPNGEVINTPVTYQYEIYNADDSMDGTNTPAGYSYINGAGEPSGVLGLIANEEKIICAKLDSVIVYHGATIISGGTEPCT